MKLFQSILITVTTVLLAFIHPSTALSLTKPNNNKNKRWKKLKRNIRNKMGASISVTQWYVYGKKHFTETGYLRHAKKYKDAVQKSASIVRGAEGADGVDMAGKVVVVTGANSGIGKDVATYVAAKGATLYMLCRSKDKAFAAKQEIFDATQNENIQVLLADMGELAQVRRVVTELQNAETQVDCLVCNAGALLNERTETSEGNEITFSSHFLGGSYLLSQLLLPQLKAAKDARTIFVTSGGMLITKLPDWETLTSTGENAAADYNGQYAYSYAKRGQVLLAERLSEMEPSIKWVTAHPGWTSTPGVDEAFGDNKKYLDPMRNPWQGAEGIAWLTHAPNLESGALYLDRLPQKKHIAGAFMTEGSYTKNSTEDVDEMMMKLRKAAGLE